MASLGELLVSIGADISGFDSGMQQVSKQLQQTDKELGGLYGGFERIGSSLTQFGGMMTAAVTLPLAGAAIASTKWAVDFELAMRKVTSLMGGVSAEEFRQLSDATRELAERMGIDAVGAAGALYQAISAGVPKENALDFLAVASQAAIAGLTDTSVAVDGITTVIQAFGLKMSDARQIADAMFQAVNVGKLEFPELAQSIGIAAGTAAALKVSYTELLAAGATLTLSTGQKIPEAMTMLQSAMKAMIEPTGDMTKLIKSAGYESGVAMVQALGLEGALQAINKAAGGNIEVLGAAYGRVEGLRGALGLTGTNAAKAAEQLDVLKNSAGAASLAFQEIDKSTSRQFQRLLNEVKSTAIELGTAMLPALNNLLQASKPLIDILGSVVSAFTELPSPVQTVVLGIGGLAVAAGPLLMTLGGISSSIPLLIKGFQGVASILGPVATGIGNVTTFITGSLVPGAYAGATAMTALGLAAGAAAIAIGAVAVVKLGESIYNLIKAHLEAKQVASDYEQALWKLHDSLASQGVVVDRGSDSLENWQKRLTEAAMKVGQLKKGSDEFSLGIANFTGTTDQASAAMAALSNAYKTLGIKSTAEVRTETEGLTKAYEVVVKAFKSGKASAEDVKKAHDALTKATEGTKKAHEDWAKSLKPLSAEMQIQVAMMQKQGQDRQKLIQQIADSRLASEREGKAAVDLTADLEKLNAELYKSTDANKALATSIPGVTAVLGNVKLPLDNYYEALNKSGIKSRETFEQIASDAGQLYETIANDPRSTAWEQDNAFLRLLRAQADAMRANGTEIPAEMAAMMDSLETTVGGRGEKLTQPWKDMTAEIDRSITDLSTSMVQSLFEGDFSFADKAKKALKGIGEAVVTHFVTPATKAISDFISGTIADLLGGKGFGGIKKDLTEIGSTLSALFGGGGGQTVNNLPVRSIPDIAGIGGAGANAGAGAGAGAAGAAGGLMGAIGAIGSIGSMISGIIGNFQNAKMETTLNAIEESTRYTKIAFMEGGDCLLSHVRFMRMRLEEFTSGGVGFRGLYDLMIGISDAVVWGATQGTAPVFERIDAGVQAISGGVQRMVEALAVPSGMTPAAVPAGGGGMVLDIHDNTFYGMSADEVANAILKRIQESGGTL